MNIKSLLNPTILLAVIAAGAIVFTALKFFDVEIHNRLDSGDNIVVLDMIKVEIAQRKYVSEILKKDVGVGGIAAAFKASGDIVKATKIVAPGYNVAVKQAFLYSDYPDITNEVIKTMGLPSVSSEEAENILSSEGTVDSMPLSFGDIGLNGDQPSKSKKRKFDLPY